MNAPRHVETSVLVAGFGAAVERVRGADLGGDDGFHGLFEALAWVGAVRDRIREESQPIPPTLNGLYYVRNLVIHRGADAVSIIAGTYGRATYGSGTYGGDAHVFPSRDELPPPRYPTGLTDYDAHVAGTDIYATLRNAVDQATGAQPGAHGS